MSLAVIFGIGGSPFAVASDSPESLDEKSSANASSCASFLRELDRTLVLVMAAVFLLCLFGFLAGYWVAKLMGLDYPTRVAMCLNTGLRNISAGSVLALQYFPAQVVFPVAFTPLFLQFTTSIIVKVLMRTPSARACAAEKERASAE